MSQQTDLAHEREIEAIVAGRLMSNRTDAAKPMPDVAAIKGRADAASPGPWSVVSDLPMYAIACGGKSGHRHRVVSTPNQNAHRYAHPGEVVDTGIEWHADAEFIASARTDVPLLLDALESVVAERDAELTRYRNARDDLLDLLERECGTLRERLARVEAVVDDEMRENQGSEPSDSHAEGYNDALRDVRAALEGRDE